MKLVRWVKQSKKIHNVSIKWCHGRNVKDVPQFTAIKAGTNIFLCENHQEIKDVSTQARKSRGHVSR